MFSFDYARFRLEACVAEIGQLKEGEFPYKDSEEALSRIEAEIRRELAQVTSLHEDSDPDAANLACFAALRCLAVHLPLLGFTLRSTNVRNAFEVYRPLRRLAADILEPGTQESDKRNTRLLLSSEWDYEPFTFIGVSSLPGFVLIGLPAAESSNPLLVPIAGHELGHSAWKQFALNLVFEPNIVSAIDKVTANLWSEYQQLFGLDIVSEEQSYTSILVSPIKAKPTRWVTRQAEESFCDFMGVSLFGEAYLRSFAYLISPKYSERRSVNYPNTCVRIRNIERAADFFEICIPPRYASLFQDSTSPFDTAPDNLLLKTAEGALEELLAPLLDKVRQIREAAQVPTPSVGRANSILGRYAMMVPEEGVHCLSDIINAGWLVYDRLASDRTNPAEKQFWPMSDSDDSHARDADKDFTAAARILKELMLKSCEVFEVEQILGPLGGKQNDSEV
jgi:hypothetical protein